MMQFDNSENVGISFKPRAGSGDLEDNSKLVSEEESDDDPFQLKQ